MLGLLFIVNSGCSPIESTKHQDNSDREVSNYANMTSVVTDHLILEYARSGGMSPATSETFRVYETGKTLVLAANAWPGGSHLDEAGIYISTISDSELTDLNKLIEDARPRRANTTFGKLRADSGVFTLKLSEEQKEISWSPFAELPNPLHLLQQRLLELLNRCKEVPIGVVKGVCEVGSDTIKLGQSIEINATLINIGSESSHIKILNDKFPSFESSLRYSIIREEKEEFGQFLLVDLYHTGEKLVLKDQFTDIDTSGIFVLAPQDQRRFTIVQNQNMLTRGKYNLFSMFEFQMQIDWEGSPIVIYCTTWLPPRNVIIE